MRVIANLKRCVTTMLISATLLLSGCADSPYSMPHFGTSAPTSPTETQSIAGQADPRLTQSDEAKFFSRSGWTACAGGAVIGVIGCQLLSHNDKVKCMLASALVLCGVAMGTNYYLDQRRSQYSNTEQRLDAMIADVREDNRKLQNLTQTARTVMAEDKQQLAKLKQDIAANKVEKTRAQQQIAEIDANTKYLKETLADLKAREKQWREVASSERASGARVDALDAEINRMQQQIASLESEIDELYQQRSAIHLG
jgi:septal ring factor EnvC (AmiA/AmiB activator)